MPQLNPPAGFNSLIMPSIRNEIAAKVASVPQVICRTCSGQRIVMEDQEVVYLEGNNKTSTLTEVGYTLAYDDGSAELNIAAEANNSVKSQIAVKYHLNVGDTFTRCTVSFSLIV